MNTALIRHWWASAGAPTSPYPDTSANTSSSNKQAILVVGDSIANGSNNSTGPGPTPSAGTVQQWNGSSVVDISNADVYNIPAGGGTFMPRMGIDYNANTGKIPVFIPCGSSGAEFSPNGDNNNWSSTGTLRADAQTKSTNCLNAIGTTQLKMIICILGINDARASTTLSTVQLDIDAFFTWLTTTYPGVPILVCQPGQTDSVTHSLRLSTIRYQIRSNAVSKTDVHLAFNLGSWINAGGYGADLLHPNQSIGNNNLGSALARWWTNLSYSKWARSIISAMYGDITTARKSAIQTAVTAIGTNLFQLENIHFLKASNAFDIGSDWSFMQLLHLNTGVVNLNSNLSTNGVDQSFETTFNPSEAVIAGQNDIFTIAKIGTNGAVGTRTLFGGSNTIFYRLTQGNIQYVVNDGTTTTAAGPIALFSNNTSYGIYRNGTTKGLLTNGVSTDSATISSTGNMNRNMRFGAFNNGSLSQFGQFEFHWIASGKFTTTDIAILNSAMNTLAAAW